MEIYPLVLVTYRVRGMLAFRASLREAGPAKLLRANRIGTVVLVTDAKSMLRAELCFRKEEVPVIPYPVGLGTFEFSLLDIVPSWKAIRGNSDTLHECLGLLGYRWAGWI